MALLSVTRRGLRRIGYNTGMLTRRTFLTASSAALATRLFAAPAGSKTPNADLEKLGAVALAEAKKLKATYADVRIVRITDQRMGLRLSPERGTAKTLAVPNVTEDSSFGFGVRVIVDGAWGFASSPIVTKEEIARVTGEAVIIAKANATIQPKPVQMAPVKAYRDRWETPHQRDPFAVPMAEKLDLLRRVSEEAKKGAKVFSSNATLSVRGEDKYFASTEGSSIQQLILQIYGNVDSTAVDRENNITRTRNYTPTQASAGWEYVPEMNLEENARRIREEVVEHLSAPAVKPGKMDLLLMPNHLMLTIHESVAHPTELDRALGYEANYAGTSYITPVNDRQADRERALHVRGRPHVAARARHGGLRRRRREGHAVDDHRQGHFQELSDHARAGALHRREGIARLQPGGQLGHGAVPAHAQCVAQSGSARDHAGRPDFRDR